MHHIIFCFLLIAVLPGTAYSQKLRLGFEKSEYIELLHVYSRQGDSNFYQNIAPSKKYRRLYRSQVVGLDNRWDLYISNDSVAVISIRGTTRSSLSWMANFYTAMVPAKGSLTLADDFQFKYALADNPRAAVHLGWLICTAFLSRDILPKVDSCYAAGIKDFIILGHSQGGAIGYLLTSHVNSLKNHGTLPQDITFKTYCSAAPKPGNLFYAYDFESMTYGGWAFNVVNSADWVPETPVAVQMVRDHNNINPFSEPWALIRQQKFPKNIALRYVYNRLRKPSNKAHKRNQYYFGKLIGKEIKKHLPGYREPDYFPSSHYVRTGHTVALKADASYYQAYPDKKEDIFVHHLIQPYLYLAERLPE